MIRCLRGKEQCSCYLQAHGSCTGQFAKYTTCYFLGKGRLFVRILLDKTLGVFDAIDSWSQQCAFRPPTCYPDCIWLNSNTINNVSSWVVHLTEQEAHDWKLKSNIMQSSSNTKYRLVVHFEWPINKKKLSPKTCFLENETERSKPETNMLDPNLCLDRFFVRSLCPNHNVKFGLTLSDDLTQLQHRRLWSWLTLQRARQTSTTSSIWSHYDNNLSRFAFFL